MSKSLSIFVPSICGAALIAALAFGFSLDKIGTLNEKIEQVEGRASAALEQAQADKERALALKEEASELQQKIADVRAAAKAASSGADLTQSAPRNSSAYGLGREALTEEITAWDVDVLPDGRGLPEGSGSVLAGEEIFAEKCASCHGDFAEGVDNWPVLAGGFDTLADKDPVKTVGSYWPHLSTAWDYIQRSMPFGDAGSLTTDETYAIVAYILYSNDLVDDDFELSHENFTAFEMYNKDGFVVDDRPTLEYEAWRSEPCMENCKDSVEITMRATFLDVTPEDGGESVMNHAALTDTPVFSASAASGDEGSATPANGEETAADPALVAAGKKVFRKCGACHQVGEGAVNRVGPHLNGIMGRRAGVAEGFKYSKALAAMADDGLVWDSQAMKAFLANPKAFIKGTKMAFNGLKKEGDQEAIIAYLNSFLDE